MHFLLGFICLLKISSILLHSLICDFVSMLVLISFLYKLVSWLIPLDTMSSQSWIISNGLWLFHLTWQVSLILKPVSCWASTTLIRCAIPALTLSRWYILNTSILRKLSQVLGVDILFGVVIGLVLKPKARAKSLLFLQLPYQSKILLTFISLDILTNLLKLVSKGHILIV